MGIRLGLQLKSSEVGILKMRSVPPPFVPNPYSGSWAAGYGGIISNNGRTIDEDGEADTIPWNTSTNSGKVYLEVTITRSPKATQENLVPIVGWINSKSSGYFSNKAAYQVFYYPTGTGTGRIWINPGNTSPNNLTGIVVPKFNEGSTVMLARAAIGSVWHFWFGVDGVWVNNATVEDILGGSNATYTISGNSIPYLAVNEGYAGSGSCIFEVNQGQKPYLYTCPTGFTPMGSPLNP